MNKLREWIDTVAAGQMMLGESDQMNDGIPKRQVSLKELRRLINAGRRRKGLFTLYDMNRRSTASKEIFYDGEPVTIVAIETAGASNRVHSVRFFGGDKIRELVTFWAEPILIDDAASHKMLGEASAPPTHPNVPARLPKLLRTAIQTFAANHPEYAIQSTAHDHCREASIKFCDLLRDMGYRGELGVEELAVVGDITHRAAFCFGYWIDWTARQYDPTAPWPAIGKEHTKWTYADHLRRPGFEVY